MQYFFHYCFLSIKLFLFKICIVTGFQGVKPDTQTYQLGVKPIRSSLIRLVLENATHAIVCFMLVQ